MPGPGDYDKKMLYDGRDYNISGQYSIHYSISKGEAKDHDDGIPGPGHYKVPCKFADVPKYLMPNQSEEFKYV